MPGEAWRACCGPAGLRRRARARSAVVLIAFLLAGPRACWCPARPGRGSSAGCAAATVRGTCPSSIVRECDKLRSRAAAERLRRSSHGRAAVRVSGAPASWSARPHVQLDVQGVSKLLVGTNEGILRADVQPQLRAAVPASDSPWQWRSRPRCSQGRRQATRWRRSGRRRRRTGPGRGGLSCRRHSRPSRCRRSPPGADRHCRTVSAFGITSSST